MDSKTTEAAAVVFTKGRKRRLNVAEMLDKTTGERQRFETYRNLRCKLESVGNEILSNISEKMIAEAKEFLSTQLRSSSDHIPSVALVFGSNISDYESTILQLQTELKSLNFFVAKLAPNDFTNLKHVMQSLVGQIRCEFSNAMSTGFNELDSTSLYPIEFWYADAKKKPKAFAIILESLESLPKLVLEELISICCSYAKTLPITFCMCLGTATTSLHRLLPHSIIARLVIKSIHTPPPNVQLNELVEKLLLSPKTIPLLFGPKVSSFAINNFLNNDFSLNNFLRTLKLGLLHHFMENPLSALIGPEVEKIERHLIGIFKDENLRESLINNEFLSDLLQNYDEEAELGSPMQSARACAGMLELIHEWRINFEIILKCACELLGHLPNNPLGRSIADVLQSVWQPDSVFDSEDYQQAMKLLRMESQPELIASIKRLEKIIKSAQIETPFLEDLGEKLQRFEGDFENVEERQRELEEKEKPIGTKNRGGISSKNEKMTLETLKERLREAQKLKKSCNFFEKERDAFVDFWDKILRHNLSYPKSLRMIEASCFDNLKAIKN